MPTNRNLSKLRNLAGVSVAGLVLLLSGCATMQTRDDPGTLAVQVTTPPQVNPLVEDRVSEAFVDQVRDVFRESGFDHPVKEALDHDEANRAPFLLSVTLTDWSISPIGNIDCTFSAELRTPQGTRHLGLYTNTTASWIGGRGRYGLARSFEEAADGAIREMLEDVRQSDMLPAGVRGRA